MNPNEKTIEAIGHLESVAKMLGYETCKEYPISKINPTITSRKRVDLALFKNNEIKVVIEVESKVSKDELKEDLEKFEFLNCKCLLLSRHIARTITPESLNFLINSRNQTEIVTKRNKYLIYNDVLYRMVKFIENNPGTYIREIARSLNIHMETVRRCLKILAEFIQIKEYGDPRLSLPQLPMLISLKNGYTAEGIIRAINTMRKIELLREKERKKITPEVIEALKQFIKKQKGSE
jgi:hypothetical protein